MFKYSEMGLWSKLVLDREFAIQQSPTHGSKLSDVKKKSKQLLLVLATIAGMYKNYILLGYRNRYGSVSFNLLLI